MLGYFSAAAICLAAVVLVGWDPWPLADIPGVSYLFPPPEDCAAPERAPERLISSKELGRYSGTEGSPGLYLALLGQVFDVQKGHKHYGPGGSYSFFSVKEDWIEMYPLPGTESKGSLRVWHRITGSLRTCISVPKLGFDLAAIGFKQSSNVHAAGSEIVDMLAKNWVKGRDASRAYVTGDFSETGLVDDVSGLSALEMISVKNWLSFYHKNYIYVGRLIGRFYDDSGQPTEALRIADAVAEEGLKLKAQSDEEKKHFPPCNSEFTSSTGTRVWCSKQSGGIERDWIGVPRKLYKPGAKDHQCVCVRTSGPPDGHPEATEHSDRGNLDDPSLQEYEDCHPLFEWCMLKD